MDEERLVCQSARVRVVVEDERAKRDATGFVSANAPKPIVSADESGFQKMQEG